MTNVVHNKDKNFSITLENGDVAHLDYQRQGNEYNFYHTFVPKSARGAGVAEVLSTHAMNYIRTNDFKAILSCSYLSDRWLPKNQQYLPYIIKTFSKL